MMEVPFADLKTQYLRIKSEVDQAVHNVFAGGQFIGGKFVDQFESAFAGLMGTKNCIGVANGTDAILVAIRSLGLKPGDEVITASFGWISASEMITLAGGKVVFVDVLPDGTIDPEKVKAAITPRTKGVVVTHLYGQAARVGAIRTICQTHALFLVEDCAQAHLTEEDGALAGTFGDAGTFSFYPTKNLGAYGDAGCIVTNRNEIEKEIRNFANHGGLHEHVMEGINSRLDPLQAAMLTVKIRHLKAWTAQRIAHAALYRELLNDLKQLALPETRANTVHTFHLYVIRTPQRDGLKDFLARKGIQTLIHYPAALHNLPAYTYLKLTEKEFPVATECQRTVLSLPLYPELSREQIAYVCQSIHQFFGQAK
jgi:dTDP-4-amino-4,6-dideoxygalactose transaminase